MRQSRLRRLMSVGIVTAVVATMLALVATVMPSAEAAPGKVPDGAVTFTTLTGAFNVGAGGAITLPVRHPNSPNECADGIDNELGEFHGGSAGAQGTPAKDGLIDFAGSGTTGYATSNGGEATTAGPLHNFPRGCTSAADDLELGGHVYGFRPTCIPFFACANGLNLPDPQPRQFFDIDATVAGNTISIANPADVSVPDNILLFGSCSGTICANYIAQIELNATNNEVQELRVDATGGTFTLTYNGNTTAALPYNVSAANLDTALEGLPGVGAGNVAVTGGLGGDGGDSPYRIAFTGALAATNVSQITANGAGLTGGGTTATTSTLRDGGVNLTGTTQNDGSGTLDLGFDVSLNLFKTIDSADLAPFTGTCGTSIELNLTSGTSGALEGRPFDTGRETLTVVDGQFTMPPFVETAGNPIAALICEGANDALGLWDANKDPANFPGDNEVVINASTAAGPWDTAGSDIVADAGADQVVDECGVFTLDGSGSFNVAQSTPVVSWNQIAGSGTALVKNDDTLTPEVVAPAGDDVLAFDLDYETLIGPHPDNTRTDSDSVQVTVNNVAPDADAGADFATSTGKAAVPLSGTADDTCTETGDLVTTWSQTGGPAVPIADPSALDTTFDTTGLGSATTLTFQLAVDDGTDVTTDTVVVDVRQPASGVIGGIVDDDSGTPLAGIDARLYIPGSGYQGKVSTAGGGDYAHTGLTDGAQYTVLFNDPSGTYQPIWFGQSTNFDDRAVATAPDLAVDGTLIAEADAGTLSGTVTDAATGAPLAGVQVVLHDENGGGFVWNSATNKVERGQAFTDGSGNWTMTGLNPGDHYRVRFFLANYTEQWNEGKAWGWTADEISVSAGQTVTGVDASLTPRVDRATLSGTVTNGDTGADEVQTITVTSGGTRSMYDVTFGGETIRVEATQSATDLQTDLERLPGLDGNIDVFGTPGNYTIIFENDLAKTNVDQIAVASLSEVQTLRVAAAAGNYTITFNGQTTAAIPFNATAATVQTSLEALANIAPGDISVTGGVGELQGDAPYQIVFLDTGAYAFQDVPEMTTAGIATVGTTQGTFVETVRGGSTVGSATTTGGVAESPLQGVEVRAYSASVGKYVLLDDTDVNGNYAVLLPLDTYRIRFVDPVNGKVWEWYDDLQTLDAATPAYLFSDTVDLTVAGSTVDVDASLAAP